MKYFTDCKTYDETKKKFRRLAMEMHPDHGGNEAEFKAMLNEYESLAGAEWTASYNDFKAKRGFDPKANVDVFAEMLNVAIRLAAGTKAEIEIVGYWIYVFKSFEIKDDLKAAGFWFSGKHKAWIYNGSDKDRKRRTRMSLDDIRALHGSQKIKADEAEEVKRISA